MNSRDTDTLLDVHQKLQALQEIDSGMDVWVQKQYEEHKRQTNQALKFRHNNIDLEQDEKKDLLDPVFQNDRIPGQSESQGFVFKANRAVNHILEKYFTDNDFGLYHYALDQGVNKEVNAYLNESVNQYGFWNLANDGWYSNSVSMNQWYDLYRIHYDDFTNAFSNWLDNVQITPQDRNKMMNMISFNN